MSFRAVASTREGICIHVSFITDTDEVKVISFLGVRTDKTGFQNLV